jgi:hypothetical protein
MVSNGWLLACVSQEDQLSWSGDWMVVGNHGPDLTFHASDWERGDRTFDVLYVQYSFWKRVLTGAKWHADDDSSAREVEYPYDGDGSSKVYSALVSRDEVRAHGLKRALIDKGFLCTPERCEHAYDCCGRWYSRGVQLDGRTRYWVMAHEWAYMNI